MQIGIIGTGYVGLITGVMLSEYHNVNCFDIDKDKIEKLNNKEIPIYEKDLENYFNKNFGKSLFFTTDAKEFIENSEVLFISVGTPPNEDGSADLKYVYEVARIIGQYINSYKVIVDKSTVPIGTAKNVKSIIKEELLNRKIDIPFDVVSNPEFLREGNAMYDVMFPDRVVIGYDSEKAIEVMREVYSFYSSKRIPIIETNIESAEFIKYASNAFLAVKISYINELSKLAEKVGANIIDIAKGMGFDKRIGNKFLNAGCGFGGSCFPKDTRALVEIAKKNDMQLQIVESAVKANIAQKERMVEKIMEKMQSIENKTIAVWGLTFKADTDDTREAPSLYIIRELIKRGAKINAYDPKGMEEFKWRTIEDIDNIKYCKDEIKAVENADCLVILTEWSQFKEVDFETVIWLMKNPIMFDYRNMFHNDEKVKFEFDYIGVGI